MGTIATGLQESLNRIDSACHASARDPSTVRLLAVSKTFPSMAVREAHAAGQRCFGESYLQEAVAKQDELTDLDIEWHFIGPIQSNKTRPIAERFDWVHGIERLKIAQRLSDARPADMPPLNACIEVNVSGETSKHGVPPEEALALARQISGLACLRLRGFMCIPQASDDPIEQRHAFGRLRGLLDRANAAGLALDTLSMGMSDDLEAAIQEGATIVRVGTAIFGKREYT